jgi:hypothetical protein
MTWLGWLLVAVARGWGACFALALPVFVVIDTRNNRAHGLTGPSGWAHTLARVPGLALIAPLYVALVVRQALDPRRW